MEVEFTFFFFLFTFLFLSLKQLCCSREENKTVSGRLNFAFIEMKFLLFQCKNRDMLSSHVILILQN